MKTQNVTLRKLINWLFDINIINAEGVRHLMYDGLLYNKSINKFLNANESCDFIIENFDTPFNITIEKCDCDYKHTFTINEQTYSFDAIAPYDSFPTDYVDDMPY